MLEGGLQPSELAYIHTYLYLYVISAHLYVFVGIVSCVYILYTIHVHIVGVHRMFTLSVYILCRFCAYTLYVYIICIHAMYTMYTLHVYICTY